MRKSLIIFAPFYPPHVGGLENYIESLSLNLVKKASLEVTIFAPDIPQNNNYDGKLLTGIKIIRYPAFEIVYNFPCPKFWSRIFFDMWGEIKKNKYDIQMTHTRFFLSSLFPFFYGRKRAKWIHVEHGSAHVVSPNIFITIAAFVYDRLIGRMVLKKSDKVVCVSNSVKDFVKRVSGIDAELIHFGIDFGLIGKVRQNLVYKKPNKINIGYLGRLMKWKNVKSAILAIRKIKDTRIELFIAGSGEEYSNLRKYESGNIHFLGSLSRLSALSFLKGLDIYVHSSLPGGGLSASLLEAMYSGCIVVATPNEGASEVINKKNGYLVKGCSVMDIKSGILEAINQKDKWPRIRKSSRKFVKTNFSWEVAVKQFISFFES